MSDESLEQAIQAAGTPVELLRNSQIGPYAFPVIRTEYTNWRDEQRAWAETCALFDLSYHMTDLYVEGPDALKLFSDLAANTFNNFKVKQAKQFIACNPDGFVIGDGILFHLDEGKFNLTGRPPIHNWVQYKLASGDYKAKAERDERTADKPSQRKAFRFQIQGPNAARIMEAVLGRPAPDIRFFHMDDLSVKGCNIRALRHGMAGQAGWELFGPWDYGDKVKAALLEAGEKHGMRHVGSRAYPSATLESGWIPSFVPAVYDGDEMKAYRQWLSASSYEGNASLGGSFYSKNIRDYYLTPYDLGLGPFVKFDHQFVGRTALEQMAKTQTRKKVTIVWNRDDLKRIFGSLWEGQDIFKYMDMPVANYATIPFDSLLKDSAPVGVATSTGYTYNSRATISLGVINIEHSEPGTEVTLVWGEAARGSSKPTVERHAQIHVRGTVAPAPFTEAARVEYRR
jgi:vanillate/3-O-methylgallate O-demethylase